MRPLPAKIGAILIFAPVVSSAVWAASASGMLALDLMTSGKPMTEPVVARRLSDHAGQ